MRTELDELVLQGLPIVEAVARRMEQKLGYVLARDELLELARTALVDAVRAFEPNRAPFGAFIAMKVKWALLDEARKRGRRLRIRGRAAACAALERLLDHSARNPPVPEPLRTESEYQADLAQLLAQQAAAMAVGFASVLDDEKLVDDRETPEDDLARKELRRDLTSAIAKLPERHRVLVERHYFSGETFEVIAADLAISKSWASRLHAQAMDALATALRESE